MVNTMDRLLDLARWAPSGDNTQCWQFEVLGDDRLVIHGFDTRTHCVYDMDGHASQLAIGALLETLHIAATGLGLRADIRRRLQAPDDRPTFDVSLVADASVRRDPLIDCIARRSVQRRPYSTRRLTTAEKQALQASMAPGYTLRWYEGFLARWQMALLMFRSAKIRLTSAEAFRVHHDIIEWGQRYSDDRVPDQALGVDALSLRLMRWAMRDWNRVQFLNRYLAGTWTPRLQMDFVPAIRSGAHVAIVADTPPATVDDYIAAGRAVQRCWLTATQLGLQHQPEVTPLIFSRYARHKLRFSASSDVVELSEQLSRSAERVVGADIANVVWLGRLGHAPAARARSLRRSRPELTRVTADGAGTAGGLQR